MWKPIADCEIPNLGSVRIARDEGGQYRLSQPAEQSDPYGTAYHVAVDLSDPVSIGLLQALGDTTEALAEARQKLSSAVRVNSGE